MSNGYFNGQTRASVKGGSGGAKLPKAGGRPAFKEKPGFMTGAPGRKQKGDRSGGAKRAKIYPDSDGI